MPTSPNQSGFLVEVPGMPNGNFEAVTTPTSIAGEFIPHVNHFTRDNSPNGRMRWSRADVGTDRHLTLPSLIHSSFGYLEMVAVERTSRGRRLGHFWRHWGWQAPTHFTDSGNWGAPAFIQSRYGNPNAGNFEVFVPDGDGFAHFYRNNDRLTTGPWAEVERFGSGNWAGVSVLHSRHFGNLEMIAVPVQGQLAHFWGAPHDWETTPAFLPGQRSVRGVRAGFIQSGFGRNGNFEVVAAAESVPSDPEPGLLHWWRDNDDPALPWHGPFRFGRGVYDDVSLIQSSYGRNFEVLAYRGDAVDFYWRESGPPWTWHGPFRIGTMPVDRGGTTTPPPPPPPPQRTSMTFTLGNGDWQRTLNADPNQMYMVVAPPGVDRRGRRGTRCSTTCTAGRSPCRRRRVRPAIGPTSATSAARSPTAPPPRGTAPSTATAGTTAALASTSSSPTSTRSTRRTRGRTR